MTTPFVASISVPTGIEVSVSMRTNRNEFGSRTRTTPLTGVRLPDTSGKGIGIPPGPGGGAGAEIGAATPDGVVVVPPAAAEPPPPGPGAPAPSSNAPRSQVATASWSPSTGRAKPRSSVVAHVPLSPASIAELGDWSAIVIVGPPLSASAARFGSAGVSAKPHVPSLSRFSPTSVMGLLPQSAPMLLARIEFAEVASSAVLSNPPPPVDEPALFPAIVTLVNVAVPLSNSTAPPNPLGPFASL